MNLHVDLICRSRAADTDGIRDHTVLLSAALDAPTRTSARTHDLRRLGDTRDLAAVLGRWPTPSPGVRQVVLLHATHTPLPVTAARGGSRTRSGGCASCAPRFRLLCWCTSCGHPWIPSEARPSDFRSGLCSRCSPRRLISSLCRPNERLVALVRPLAPRAGGVLPVGSNLPDARSARTHTRARLGIRDGQPVLAAFGTSHPTRLFGLIGAAIAAVGLGNSDVVVLNLGASSPDLCDGFSGRMVRPGHVAALDLARYLSTADLLLLPFSDGAATRRTTIMAGLQHGIPILSTDGTSTSGDLRDSGAIALTPADAPAGVYARRAWELLADAPERDRLGQAGRQLYEKRFSWSVIAERLVEMIEESPTPGEASSRPQ